MKVKYIYNSGVIVEIENTALIFDYYISTNELDLKKYDKIYFFSSHAHSDHFTSDIFKYNNEKVKYILSSDISKGYDANYISPHEEIIVDGIKIKTLDSTDEGVAFLVTVNGKTIYHAGDLNWWHWNGEKGDFNILQEKKYKEEISLLKELEIDIAFVPVDPRLEDAMLLGIEYFTSVVKAKEIYPIHFRNKIKEIQTLCYNKKIKNLKFYDIIIN